MLMRSRILLSVFAACFCASSAVGAAPQAGDKTVASGKTQVVAKAGGREITLTELRLEMGRLGLSPADPASERAALESLLNRTLLAKAARAADLHRKPETMARMYAAQDQALADYYLALASQPAEPTRQEIDDFVRANPSMFAERKIYEFSVLSLESKNFNEKALTPLFDHEADFSRLTDVLTTAGARYTLAGAVQSGAAFPAPIREQLARYGARDNIVIKGDETTQIMKIMGVRPDNSDAAEWPPLARRFLLEEAAGKRGENLMARLRKENDIAYYRSTAAPPPQKAK
jgi:EpsD family peptidyl-prolyl cis-trans isomerase